MTNSTNNVVRQFTFRKALVTTFVGQNPHTSEDSPLGIPIHWPQEVFWPHRQNWRFYIRRNEEEDGNGSLSSGGTSSGSSPAILLECLLMVFLQVGWRMVQHDITQYLGRMGLPAIVEFFLKLNNDSSNVKNTSSIGRNASFLGRSLAYTGLTTG